MAGDSTKEERESIAKLLAQNRDLQKKVDQYKRLEEDIVAQRVFEKAKKQITT